jgi:hypothetical protein
MRNLIALSNQIVEEFLTWANDQLNSLLGEGTTKPTEVFTEEEIVILKGFAAKTIARMNTPTGDAPEIKERTIPSGPPPTRTRNNEGPNRPIRKKPWPANGAMPPAKANETQAEYLDRIEREYEVP